MRPLIWCVALSLVACSGKSGDDQNTTDGNNANGDGNNATADAPSIDAAPMSLTISGVTEEISSSGRTPIGNVTVTAYRASDDSMIATTTSSNASGSAKGTFMMTAPTNGQPIDGYLVATDGNTYLTSYLYPPKPISADFPNATVFLLTQSTFNTVQSLTNVTQTAGNGFVAVEVVNAQDMTVGGAAVTTGSGTVKYNGGALGLPSKTATVTANDGIAYIFNVTAGNDDVGATKTGSTFLTHTIKARADVITLTEVTP
jgi:hypothetical protein